MSQATGSRQPRLRLVLPLLTVVLGGACGSDEPQSQTEPASTTERTPTTQTTAAAAAGSSGAGSALAGTGAGPANTTANAPRGAAGSSAGRGAVGTPSSAAAGAAGSGGAAGSVSAAAGSGGTGGVPVQTTAGAAGATAPVDVACDPADELPEATPVTGIGMGEKPVGAFATAVERDPGISDQTIFRPEPLGMIKHPVFAWGNGGCMQSNSGFSEFLLQIAAEGVVVIADGPGNGSSNSDGSQLIAAIDWAEKENERPCSKFYHKLDLEAVAVSGQSCGGLMAINASDDPRVTMSMPMNSGLMAPDQTLYAALHAPMAIINGGSSDIAYDFGNQTYEAIDNIPIMVANIDVGHGGTYRQDNGGEMGKMALAWVRWHLLKDEGATGKGMFIGDSCGFCNSEWEMMWKMKPQ